MKQFRLTPSLCIVKTVKTLAEYLVLKLVVASVTAAQNTNFDSKL